MNRLREKDLRRLREFKANWEEDKKSVFDDGEEMEWILRVMKDVFELVVETVDEDNSSSNGVTELVLLLAGLVSDQAVYHSMIISASMKVLLLEIENILNCLFMNPSPRYVANSQFVLIIIVKPV